jgi:hypothetical protein
MKNLDDMSIQELRDEYKKAWKYNEELQQSLHAWRVAAGKVAAALGRRWPESNGSSHFESLAIGEVRKLNRHIEELHRLLHEKAATR